MPWSSIERLVQPTGRSTPFSRTSGSVSRPRYFRIRSPRLLIDSETRKSLGKYWVGPQGAPQPVATPARDARHRADRRLGHGPSCASRKTKRVGARIEGLKATESICPYCAVGCAQVVYTHDGELVDVEGHPRSPVNQGTLCPKGSAPASSSSSRGACSPSSAARRTPPRRLDVGWAAG
jgi:Molybdopterin oxidoreductase Fe4S4 domain